MAFWNLIFITAMGVLTLAAAWAVVTPRIKASLLGDAAFMLICFTSLASIASALQKPVDHTHALFGVSIALIAVRCYFIKTWAKYYRRKIRRILCNLQNTSR